jgi:hypothetical protein
MGALFIAFVSLVLYHFIIESILLPEIRLVQRFKLQSIRDRLNDLHLSATSNSDRKELIDQTLKLTGIGLQHLEEIDLRVLLKVNKIAREQMRSSHWSDVRNQEGTNAECHDLHVLQEKAGGVIARTAVLNHLGWLPYLVLVGLPFVLVAFLVGPMIYGYRRLTTTMKSILYNTTLNETDPTVLESFFASPADRLTWK